MKTIEEIMGLVNTLVASVNEAHHANTDDWRGACFKSSDEAYKAIKSALRELVERKPLSYAELAIMENECWAKTVDKGLPQFDFVKLLKDKIEAHHKIGA